MPQTRQQIADRTAEKLAAAASTLASVKGVIGLDGFVDQIVAVVDKRQDDRRYDPVRTIGQLGEKITAAAGHSSNYELVVKQMKLGGNGPIMANALASLGMSITYIGNLGYPTLHPVFDDFSRHANVISISEPGYTDALEFEDGKLMFGKMAGLHEITWDHLISRVGRDELKQLYGGAKLVGMVNWTMIPQMSEIWEKMLEEIVPGAPGDGRTFFVDLADPEKRSREDILGALKLLSRFQRDVDVVLGLNLKESTEIVDVLGLAPGGDPEAAIETTAADIRGKLGLACVIIHPRKGAAAATAEGTARFAGPFIREPKISTGAGDHFNAGFCLGRVLGFSLEESLCSGVATSGFYVRNAQSPSAAELARFIGQLPAPQE